MYLKKKYDSIEFMGEIIIPIIYYVLYCITRFSANISNTLLGQQLGFSQLQVQTLCFLFSISYAILQIPLGFLQSVISPSRLLRYLLLISLGGLILSMISNKFYLLCISRILLGTGFSMAAVGLWSCLQKYTPEYFLILSGLSTGVGVIIPIIMEKSLRRINNPMFLTNILQLIATGITILSHQKWGKEEIIDNNGKFYFQIMREDVKKIFFNPLAISLLVNVCFLVGNFYITNNGITDIYMEQWGYHLNYKLTDLFSWLYFLQKLFFVGNTIFFFIDYHGIFFKDIIGNLQLIGMMIIRIIMLILLFWNIYGNKISPLLLFLVGVMAIALSILEITSKKSKKTIFFSLLIILGALIPCYPSHAAIIKYSYGVAGFLMPMTNSLFSPCNNLLLLSFLNFSMPLTVLLFIKSRVFSSIIFSFLLGFISKGQIFTVIEWTKCIPSKNYSGIYAILNFVITGMGASFIPYLSTIIMECCCNQHGTSPIHFLIMTIIGGISLISCMIYIFLKRKHISL